MSRPRNSESVFRAIADPTRRRMLDLLRDGERPVGELIETMRLQRTAASYHFGVLINAGLMRQRRRGRQRVCVLETAALGEAHAWLARYPARGGSR